MRSFHLSRADSVDAQGSFTPEDLGACTQHLAALFSGAFSKAGLVFDVTVSGPSQPVFVDLDWFEKVGCSLSITVVPSEA